MEILFHYFLLKEVKVNFLYDINLHYQSSKMQHNIGTLDVLFHQITMIIKVRVALVFGLQTLSIKRSEA